MNKKVQSMFEDFIGEMAMVGEFTIGKHDNEYWILCDNEPVVAFSEDNDEFVTTKKQVEAKLRQWKREVKMAVNDAIDCIDNEWYSDEDYNEDYNEDYDEDYDEDYGTVERQYIGSVFSLSPSGKYYTPWANSNVNIIEACKDSMFYELLEKKLDKMGMWLESGDGDPCDLYVCR